VYGIEIGISSNLGSCERAYMGLLVQINFGLFGHLYEQMSFTSTLRWRSKLRKIPMIQHQGFLFFCFYLPGK
jgi:hypothetical protein